MNTSPNARPTVAIVVPAFNEAATIAETLCSISSYFRTTGLTYEIVAVDDGSTDSTPSIIRDLAADDASIRLVRLLSNQGKGAAVRRGVHEARGEVIAFIDADLPYRLDNVGSAVALVHSGVTDIAIGARDLPGSERDPSYPFLRRFMGRSFALIVRTFLVRGISDTQCGLKAFSSDAAKLLFTESKIEGFGFDFEVLYLANRYGFRVERIPVSMSHRHESKVRLVQDSLRMLVDVFRVRWNDRQMVYRRVRICPVCFSGEVYTLLQVPNHVVRACHRCKCRYLGNMPTDEELEKFYDNDYFSSECDLEKGYSSRTLTAAVRRTDEKRLAILRRVVPGRARVLEVGAGNGLFGTLASSEYDYVGLDLSQQAVKEGRARGLELYRSSLSSFVNLGGGFDAVALFHVFEHFTDPHEALDRLRSLLKPGGVVVLITPDTESLLCAVSGDRWVSYKFPEHVILYSRSALIELLEHSGFEIMSVSSDSEYCDHEFLRTRLESLHPMAAALSVPFLKVLPDPIAVNTGSLRVVAKRRSGVPWNTTAIRTTEPTHAG